MSFWRGWITINGLIVKLINLTNNQPIKTAVSGATLAAKRHTKGAYMSTVQTITESIQIQPKTKTKRLAFTGVVVGIGPSDLMPSVEIATIALFRVPTLKQVM